MPMAVGALVRVKSSAASRARESDMNSPAMRPRSRSLSARRCSIQTRSAVATPAVLLSGAALIFLA